MPGNGIELLFFLEPAEVPFAFDLLNELTGDDNRFFFDSSRLSKNYNYSTNQMLADAIQKGHRGAYRDILRKILQ